MGSTVAPPAGDPKLELYKSEYELTSARYENIFEAIWQNFSYMTAISGAVLAFGGDRLQPHFLWFIACLPLVFWYWATFEPLNRYGKMAQARLVNIEKELNRLYDVKMEHHIAYQAHLADENLGAWKKFVKNMNRVTYRVGFCFYLLTAIFLYHSFFTAKDVYERKPLTREQRTEVKIVTLSPDELEKLLYNKGATRPEKEPPPATQPKN